MLARRLGQLAPCVGDRSAPARLSAVARARPARKARLAARDRRARARGGDSDARGRARGQHRGRGPGGRPPGRGASGEGARGPRELVQRRRAGRTLRDTRRARATRAARRAGHARQRHLALPREPARGRAARARRGRRPRTVGAPALRSPAPALPPGALRGTRDPARWPHSERAGPSARARGRGRPSFRRALRGRRPRGEPRPERLLPGDQPLPPARAAAARARKRRRRAGRLAPPPRLVPQLRLGRPVRPRQRAVLVCERPGDAHRACSHRAPGVGLRLRARGSDR